MPRTSGETLAGKQMVLADEVRGHPVVLVAGFSREGGSGVASWVKSIRADSVLAGWPVYEIAQIAGAPGFVRGMIKRGMKKKVPAADQDRFVVLIEDEKQWREYFNVSDDKVPYVVALDEAGKVLWRGHGGANLEPHLREAIHP